MRDATTTEILGLCSMCIQHNWTEALCTDLFPHGNEQIAPVVKEAHAVIKQEMLELAGGEPLEHIHVNDHGDHLVVEITLEHTPGLLSLTFRGGLPEIVWRKEPA